MRFVAEGPDRLDKFLATSLPEHSRSKLARLISDGGVLVDGVRAKPSLKLEPGMVIELDEPVATPAHDLTPSDIQLDVVYEDEFLLLVNKPRGLATHPAASLKEPSLVNALLGRGGELSDSDSFRPGIVHRLDKETTGLLVVAKTDVVHANLAKQIELKTAERKYLAVVGGKVEQERFTVNAALARDKRNKLKMAIDPYGKNAVTHIKLIKRLDRGTLVAAKLETGRTHQIRVHLSAVGLPVIGDDLYAPKEHREGVPLQLHAAYLGFKHPGTGEDVSFFAPPPEDFLAYGQVEATELESF
ncbi:MAG: RluA family pseudouridine synthase [Fimbriimonas sp.]